MRPTILRRATLVAATLAALAASATAAHAQVEAQAMGRRGGNQGMIDRAVESYGFDPRRLTRAQQADLDEAWELLLPGESPTAYRLNATQALALAYVGLVLRQQPGDAGGDRPRRPRGEDDRGYGQCRAAVDAVFALAQNSPLSQSNNAQLTTDEVAATRRAVLEVQRLNVECGCEPLASATSDLARYLNATRVYRSVVAPRVTNLPDVVQACGRRADAPRS